MAQQKQVQTSDEKPYIGAVMLSLILGIWGVDRFYMGYVGTGVIKLLTFGGLGIWYIIDLILIYSNSLKTKAGKSLTGYPKDRQLATIFIAVVFISNIVSGIYMIYSFNNLYHGLKQGITVETEEGTASFKLGEPVQATKPK